VPSWLAASLPVLIALALSLTALQLGWRGSDLPAHVFRVGLIERNGFEVWNNFWYGGHYTPGYSLMFPVLGAFIGIWTVAVLSAGAAALLFDRVVVTALGRRSIVASAWFAAATVTNLAVGRLPFALGLAVALLSVHLAQRHHRLGTLAAATATALASPVAGAFLALTYVAWSVAGDRSERSWRLGAGALAVGPVLVMATLFPQGGMFPFRWTALVWTLAVCLVVAALVPARFGIVRVGAGLYALTCLGAFVVPTPVGANVTRLGMYFAGPVLVACLGPPFRFARGRSRGGWRQAAVAAMALPLLWWQWSPALDAVVRAGTDESTDEAFYEPLLQFVHHNGGELQRIEIVPTDRHWETAYVALDVPIARGWERQLDIRYHPLFYDEVLTADAYREWLDDNGVGLVALPDAPLDESGAGEAALLDAGVDGLRLVWEHPDWRVWQVEGAAGLVDGPARLWHLDADSLGLNVTSPGDVLVRIRHSDAWTGSVPVCVEASPDGWLLLRDLAPGTLELSLDGARTIPLLDDDPCAVPTTGSSGVGDGEAPLSQVGMHRLDRILGVAEVAESEGGAAVADELGE
jgi:hypothetical protein